VATILMIFLKSTTQVSADWYGAAIPAIPHSAPLTVTSYFLNVTSPTQQFDYTS